MWEPLSPAAQPSLHSDYAIPGSATPRQGLTFHRPLRGLVVWFRRKLCRFEIITTEDTEKNSFRSLQRRQHSDKIFREAPAIICKHPIHSFKFLPPHNQAALIT